MRAAESVEAFLADPVGSYIAGESFLVWLHAPNLGGSVYFGRPSEADFPVLRALFLLAEHPALEPPLDVVIDCAALEQLNLPAFELLREHFELLPRLAAKVGRASIVRPQGLWGATIAGLFYEGVQQHFRAALFTDRAEAFTWLGRQAARHAIDDVIATVRQTPPILQTLRAHLAAQLPRPALPSAARAVGLSQRSLQRRLTELGTSYGAELTRARLRAAEALLIDSQVKLESIARQVGCSSSSHLTTLFRRFTGETPSEFRARRST